MIEVLLPLDCRQVIREGAHWFFTESALHVQDANRQLVAEFPRDKVLGVRKITMEQLTAEQEARIAAWRNAKE